MGRAVLRLAAADPRLQVVAAVSRSVCTARTLAEEMCADTIAPGSFRIG